MTNPIKKISDYTKKIFEQYRFLKKRAGNSTLNNKVRLQLIIAVSFLILSGANIFVGSWPMLCFTLFGGLTNGICAIISKKTENGTLCAASSIIVCSVMFGFFVIYGGNDGFACQWVVLLPFFAMVVMDFAAGLTASIFFQIFLIVVFWTPIKEHLFYQYNAEFCLRFPLFFFVANMLGLFLTISLQNSRYNEIMQLDALEEMRMKAEQLSKIDPLTGLANRRCAYEEFALHFSDTALPHSVVMGDIDRFKQINDTYGHDFGDRVLIVFGDLMREHLPEEYLKARWGGEEFLFAANEPLETVYDKVENLRKKIEEYSFDCEGNPVKITATFGIAPYSDPENLDAAINQADERLYKGKNLSRNCTIIL